MAEQIPEYNWWGEANAPPENLKTKKQLADLGLKPGKPAGVIHTRKYDLYLYDPDNPESASPKRKTTPAQLEALAKARETQKRKAYHRYWKRNTKWKLEDKNNSIEWAQRILANKQEWLILDLETTGLDWDAEIVQIGIINFEREVLLDSLVKPTKPISQDAIAIHGITNEIVENAPEFSSIYSEIIKIFEDKKVLIYNKDFNIDVLDYCCELHELEDLNLEKKSECLMRQYAKFCNDWNSYRESYQWQPLGGDHTALGDCFAVLELLEEMAESELVELKIAFEKAWLKYNKS